MSKNRNILTFGALAILTTSSFAEELKQKKNSMKNDKPHLKASGYCEKAGDPAQSGCNTPDKCSGPKKVAAKDKADCEKMGGEWKLPEAKK